MTAFNSVVCSAELRGEKRQIEVVFAHPIQTEGFLNVHLFRVFVIIIALTFNDRGALSFVYSGQKFTKHPISLL